MSIVTLYGVQGLAFERELAEAREMGTRQASIGTTFPALS